VPNRPCGLPVGNRRNGATVTDRQAGSAPAKALAPEQRHAALPGWSTDSFDCFLVVFVLADIAEDKSWTVVPGLPAVAVPTATGQEAKGIRFGESAAAR
jgi:hypothetical protein